MCAESFPSAFIWLSQPLFSRVALAAGLLPAMDGKQPLCTGVCLCHYNHGPYRSCAVDELGVVSVGNELPMEWK